MFASILVMFRWGTCTGLEYEESTLSQDGEQQLFIEMLKSNVVYYKNFLRDERAKEQPDPEVIEDAQRQLEHLKQAIKIAKKSINESGEVLLRPIRRNASEQTTLAARRRKKASTSSNGKRRIKGQKKKNLECETSR